MAVLLTALFASRVFALSSNELDTLFGESRTIFSSSPKTGVYELYLGPMIKVNGRWQNRNVEPIEGLVQRKTLELSERLSFADMRRALAQWRDENASKVLFACEAFDCGRSSSWAVNYFDNRLLYGLDRFQAYFVFKINSAEVTRYGVVYAVQRGNRRNYLQVDTIDTPLVEESPTVKSSAQMWEALEQARHFILPLNLTSDGRRQVGSAAFVELVGLLNNHSGLRIRIVGHDFGETTLAAQRERSEAYARTLSDQLVEAGVEASRLDVFGVGSLAPMGSDQARVVIIPVSGP